MLASHHFCHSHRYPVLLKYLVEQTQNGRASELKERLLGIEVFRRAPDYDTNSDPVVRVTAAEVRKRIAQYYQEPEHRDEIRIELATGSYVPRFSRPPAAPIRFIPITETPERSASDQDDRLQAPAATPLSLVKRPPALNRRRISAVVALVILLSGAVLLWRWTHLPAIDEFWGPLLASHRTITFCIPNGAGKTKGFVAVKGATAVPVPSVPDAQMNRAPTFLDHESLGENVVFSDLLATLRISNLMAVHNRDSRVRLNVSTTLDDLRQGPVVLVGGLDNEWTLRAIASLRFHFNGSEEEKYWIADTANPGKKDWALDLKTQYASVNRDFAIIARIHDEATGQLEVIVAGIGMSGTAAAGEFLVDPHQLEELRNRVGPGFRDRDFEAVLSTDVVNGIAGSPKILTVQTR
jgi:hypothetical protein